MRLETLVPYLICDERGVLKCSRALLDSGLPFFLSAAVNLGELGIKLIPL